MVRTISDLQARDIMLRSLREGIAVSTPTAACRQRSSGRWRCRGRAPEGEGCGNPRSSQGDGQEGWPQANLTLDQAQTARTTVEAGMSITVVAETLRVSLPTVYRYTAPLEAEPALGHGSLQRSA